MKILEIEVFGRGGLTHYVFNLARELGRRGVSTTIATAAEYELAKQSETLPSNVTVVKALSRWAFRLRGRLSYRAQRALKGLEFFPDAVGLTWRAARERPDVVHVHCTNPIVVWLLLCLRLARRPVLYTAHDVTPHERSPLDRPLYKTIYRLSDHLVAHSEEDRRRLTEEFGVAAGKVTVIPHGEYSFFDEGAARIPRAEARRRMGVAADAKAALFFGFIRPYKGLDLLLESWPRVHEAVPQARLIVAGDPARLSNTERDRLHADAVAVGAVAHFTYIAFEDVPAYFAAADVLVLPYRRISQSGVLFLSYALGVPVIATRVGAFPEVIRDGENGMLVEPESPDGLADAIVRVLRDDGLRARLATAGQRTAHDLFSWEAIAERTHVLCGRLAGDAVAARPPSDLVSTERGR